MKFDDLLSCFYPNKCSACGEITDNKYLCEYCKQLLKTIDLSKFCIKCGAPKDSCRCKAREFHFKGCVSAYENKGVAKKSYYGYKILRRQYLADFFAPAVAKAVQSAYGDIKFDAVICVPTVSRSKLKRGFDHNKLIVQRLSDILGVPVVEGVLKSRHFVKPQHKSSYSKRLENVRNKYYTVKQIDLNRVLLFDDICTSGATLDQCAKELMFAGVREVYCATVLSVAKHNKE